MNYEHIGQISDIQTYNRVLSDAEIAAIYRDKVMAEQQRRD